MLSSDKATGPDGVPVKFIKISANVIDSHLVNIINKDIDLNCYSENTKTANVRPVFKKDQRTEVKFIAFLMTCLLQKCTLMDFQARA